MGSSNMQTGVESSDMWKKSSGTKINNGLSVIEVESKASNMIGQQALGGSVLPQNRKGAQETGWTGSTFKMYTDWSHVPLYCLMCPLFACLKVFGLFHVTVLICPFSNVRIKKGKCSFLHIYQLSMLLLHWLNFLRLIAVYQSDDKFDGYLFFKVSMHCFYFECAFYPTMLYCSIANPKSLPEFFRLWKAFSGGCSDAERMKCYGFRFRKIVRISVFISVCLVVINTVSIGFFLLIPDAQKEAGVILFPFAPDGDHALTAKIAFILIHLFVNAAFVLPLTAFFLFACALLFEFSAFTRDFSGNVTERGRFGGDFEKFRSRHQRICDLLAVTDRTFQHMILAVYAITIAKACFIGYTIIEGLSSGLGLAASIYWMFLAALVIGMMTTIGAMVNNAAHAPINYIYDLELRDIPFDTVAQIQTFIAKLGGPPIGLSAWGLFVIDIQLALTVVGVFASYFILMIQTGPSVAPSGPSGEACLCLQGYTLPANTSNVMCNVTQ